MKAGASMLVAVVSTGDTMTAIVMPWQVKIRSCKQQKLSCQCKALYMSSTGVCTERAGWDADCSLGLKAYEHSVVPATRTTTSGLTPAK